MRCARGLAIDCRVKKGRSSLEQLLIYFLTIITNMSHNIRLLSQQSQKRKRDASDGFPREVATSYGVLPYKIEDHELGETKQTESISIRFLLGLIPQRNWWTVLKGLPEPEETPQETAIREFREETGIVDTQVLSQLSRSLEHLTTEETLQAKVKSSMKQLNIFLVDGSYINESSFDVSKVVRIDQGYMKGRPEIVAIRWLTMEQAINGFSGAKIYLSQQSLLREACRRMQSEYLNKLKNIELCKSSRSDGCDSQSAEE